MSINLCSMWIRIYKVISFFFEVGFFEWVDEIVLFLNYFICDKKGVYECYWFYDMKFRDIL